MKIKSAHVMILFVSIMLLAACTMSFLKPSDIVHLGAYVNPGQTQDVRGGNPDATSAGLFRVPAGSVLVLTNVIIHPMNPGAGKLSITFIQSDASLGDRIRQTWRVPNSQPTQFDFSPGEVVSSGSKLMIRNDASSAGDLYVSFNGYVTPDI